MTNERVTKGGGVGLVGEKGKVVQENVEEK